MNLTSTRLVCGLLLTTTFLPSCATIISTPSQTVRVVGQPAGSTIYVNNKEVKAKPMAGRSDAMRIRLRRNKSAEITVKHEGYKEYTEVLTPDKTNALIWLNYLPLPLVFTGINSEDASTGITSLVAGLTLPLLGYGVDALSGANRRFSKKEIKPLMPRQPKAVAGSQTVQAGPINVRIKGGDKMGSTYIVNQPKDILYFGKSLDVDSDNLRNSINGSLKDLGYSVPETESKSVFGGGPMARYSLQGEMRNVKYDVYASHYYAAMAHYETKCTVEVTWKLVNQNRQTVVEQKTSGSSIKFEEGGNAVFEDAFENALYGFLEQKEVVVALAKPAGNSAATAATDEKLPAIAIHRAAALKVTGDNGVGAAAKCVVTLETTDGHGSGCIISADGYLVTNAHVVGEDETVKVRMADGIEAKGKVVRVNTAMDLALVKLDVDGLSAFQLPLQATGDLGSDVFAIGTPADKELGQSITKGIISGRRKIEGHSFLQTDVSINGGNSGGALVGRSGQLVGIVNAKLVGRGIEGIGFAIPAEQVSDALQLKFVD
ncbi:S1C family serine protease [Hymenobacter cellulosilyticus]|uniref:Trypsin-like peptidase domain-containing protein n=1 Tax=Hymenobacter cellulosilyticus TaxID=2932248 RepID=A0A8T9QAZ0_9BACT|nr:trypsin-like peptidase domain-containing protein [Hymenobacter cellulosilyticus]UOQ74667.1 trypsin-like peptidase domain-containing protein [Hymenobacter cellulosilyticus]